MPGTFASAGWRRWMTSMALRPRASRGLKLIWMRPLFSVVFVPSMPMKDDSPWTSGSFRMASAAACCRSAIAENVLDLGWHADAGAYTVAYGEPDSDAAALWIGLSGLLGADDPRFLATALKVEADLRILMHVAELIDTLTRRQLGEIRSTRRDGPPL